MREKVFTMSGRKKKKSDPTQPFAGYLAADEQILWMDGPLAAFTTRRGRFYTAIGAMCVMVFIISLGATLAFGLMCAACVVFCGLVISTLHAKDSLRNTYALTNKHLFLRTDDEVSEMPLEDVPTMRLMPGAGSQGTLSFGGEFPAIPNIEDAAYVKTMIEQAQKDRLKEQST
jgi:hypothetical protein